MSGNDPFASLLAHPDLGNRVEHVRAAVARVYRRPAVLRRSEVISAESLLRGARASVAIDGGDTGESPAYIPPLDAEPAAGSPLAHAIGAYSVLAPGEGAGAQEEAVRTFLRQPMQLLARADVHAGGPGHPVGDTERLQALAGIIVTRPSGTAYDVLLPMVLHGEIAAHQVFGPRSGLLGRVAARLAAMATGLDPRGIVVPETYLNRHRGRYREALDAYSRGEQTQSIAFQLDAWSAGAKEADGIARAA